MKKVLSILILVSTFLASFAQQVSLKGNWKVKIDSLNVGNKENWQNIAFSKQMINLPGTLDDIGIGKVSTLDTKVLNKEILTMLTRKHRYVGVAWYQKEIDLSMAIANGTLFLERVIWKTDAWIDGKYLGNQNSLIAPHKFQTGALKAGKHTIVLKIDNSKQFDVSLKDMAHAYTDGTQIIWNGVIGDMKMITQGEAVINELQIYPDLATQRINVKSTVINHTPSKKYLRFQVYDGRNLIATKTTPLTGGASSIDIQLQNIKTWSEFNPHLYKITAQILDGKKSITQKQTTFGFRNLSNNDAHLSLNGRRIFLRGTLDCNIYPLEGHPPMEKVGWLKVFNTAKSYGLNHIRFHSWCPPEAAFQVADSMGFYLQVELPLWELTIGKDKSTLSFLKTEAQNIISNYGNHPSFCFFSMGNELQGDIGWLNSLVSDLKKQDSRRFYTATTFTFEKGHGRWPEPNDDYFITQYTKNGWVRGQGVFNSDKPNFITDYSKSVEGIPLPLITHEVGQYSVFPNIDEIKKYKGVLDPLNFKAIKYDMEQKNLINLADSFKLASGKFAVNLYKEEIERALKTNNISGFQLLDLHDFPGQGTALVGLLDAFWESKGLIEAEDFRTFCAPVVPLLRFEKASYLNSERFKATIQVSNFSGKKISAVVNYQIITKDGKVIFDGLLPNKTIDFGSVNVGNIDLDLSNISTPEALTVKVSIPNTIYHNQWTIWVYPATQEIENNKVLFTKSKSEALKALAIGKTVILNPDTANIKGVNGRFTSVFWSPVHFPDQPGTMGILCNPNNPALAAFPTEFYSNWQWWDLVTKSKTMIIDSLQQIKQPIVRVIDNFFKNRKMATLIEGRVGNGKLILCSMDISTDLENRIEAKQLKYSLLKYANSEKFNPQINITEQQLAEILK